ncbi:HAD-IB family hydrolase [Epilithonimonas ginsengisoli]|uniref:phosphoserine phosphatase n=1 Tax=Epilithonimonas ginsengisoli TaxID=1245592 RepID=A0ABU4JI94_9FLAO|nr:MULTISPECIES: HAD-IB family hydrolase [Chryseobacterium group]MBV6879957.1 HAD-IB family hydrolase [Epilithonimonas sp. FP105]MDW8549404.1 HAD-IB family hydrolase [Epilithonimonas ginsengisoli]OAH70287.1 HAD family hydrolase [Chryseobacterium sp. FP211-J200]
MKKLYLFDFDGTLTYKDTMFLFLKFYNPAKYSIQFLKHVPLFILLKLKLANSEAVKKSFISSILKGESRYNIDKKAKLFFDENYPSLIRENASDFINNIDREHTESYIVSASLDIWVQPFAEKFNMTLLATKAEFKDDVFTGKFIGKNCNKDEKVCRIEAELGDKKFDKIIAFGDTSGDKPMFKFANESHYRFFH